MKSIGTPETFAVIACGAIARELVRIADMNRWDHMRIYCLPADLHNRPKQIPGAVKQKIDRLRDRHEHIFVAYADCGTGGELDRVLAQEGISRLPGAHCYEFFAGNALFSQIMEQQPGSFFLTDFLVRHFERLVIRGLGIDRHPQLQQLYFANYRQLVYLSQTEDEDLMQRARDYAGRLGLKFMHSATGYRSLEQAMTKREAIVWQN